MKNIFLISILSLMLTACGFEIVDTGHRGVKTTFGEVQMDDGSLPEDIYFYNPMTSNIVELDVRTQKWDSKTNTYTKDVQIAEIGFVLNYNLEPSFAHITYKEVGKDWADKLIPQVVAGRLKGVIGKWDAEKLINNRNIAQTEAQTAITQDLANKHILVTKFEITNIDYSDKFETAVENKVVAIQKAIEEKNRTVQIEETAKQQLITAQAEAKAIKIRGDALKANKDLVDYRAVEKWDGKMPQYMLGNGAMPFIQLNKK